VPASLKITGPDADLAKLEAYVEIALSRAARAGMDTIVFGSGGARWIPDGFSRDEAWRQLVAFGKLISPIAERQSITIVVEPLNQRECNVLNTVGESGQYVEEVDHPSFKLLLDTYHWLLDNDSYESILHYGPLVRHVHTATVATRLPPGFEPCDFGPFFRALVEIGYDGRISIEGKWDDIEVRAVKAYGYLEKLVQEAR
jgi:sugar phosphate isomerase/epimerase